VGRASAQCRLVFPILRTGTNCGADPLVRSRPPGRLADGCRRLSPHEKSGTRASRADQGVRPTTYAEPSFAKTKWHWASARLPLVPGAPGERGGFHAPLGGPNGPCPTACCTPAFRCLMGPAGARVLPFALLARPSAGAPSGSPQITNLPHKSYLPGVHVRSDTTRFADESLWPPLSGRAPQTCGRIRPRRPA
jgi:hypothetical protein